MQHTEERPGRSVTSGSAALTDAVTAAVAGTEDPRMRQVLESVVRHVHDLVREVELSRAEWAAAVRFLTAVGQASDDRRQEMILLSDVLGVSMQVEEVAAVRSGSPATVTASTVVGPFHESASPARELGASLGLEGRGPDCVVVGSVTDDEGRPVPGARVDVWQADAEGHYDVQTGQPDLEGTGRALLRADGDGRFWFRTVVPAHYPVPTDGPVGDLLRAAGRHPYRPAHIHFLVEAPGIVPLTTHVFVAGSPYLDSDAVFAVRPELIREVTEVTDPDRTASWGVDAPVSVLQVDLVVQRAASTGAASTGAASTGATASRTTTD